MTDLLIDLGDDGEILVESLDEPGSTPHNRATEKVGLRDNLQETGRKIKVSAANLLKLPLTGLVKVFLASLPESVGTEPYDLDTFSVEFNLGIKMEGGTNAGAVAKIAPEGAFKCTYTWKRKAMSARSD